MESPGTEENSSSESGWTMYIASPMEEDDAAECSEVSWAADNDNVASRGNSKKGVDESDDSMDSDASSGPSHHHQHHQQQQQKQNKQGDVADSHQKDHRRAENSSKWSFFQKASKQDKKKGKGKSNN